jgi:hypothetical protein
LRWKQVWRVDKARKLSDFLTFSLSSDEEERRPKPEPDWQREIDASSLCFLLSRFPQR